jgi:pantetheine-phosphate adenylyltransferase
VRVVAGQWKGRRLAAPAGRAVRPTSERVREAVFDMLASLGALEDAVVADLFAGTGAMGLEALSRGASHVTFVDSSPEALAAIRTNLGRLGVGPERATVVRADAAAFVAGAGRFDLAVADPPYGYERFGELLSRLDAALAVVEAERPVAPPPPWRDYGGKPGAESNTSGRLFVRIALFPGSFDPFHNGHLEIVERAARLFDEVVVAAVRNPQKGEPLFSLAERKEMLAESLAHLPTVRIMSFSSLVVNLAREIGATAIVKGLRAVSDFEAEMQMAQMNQQLSGIDTLFIPTHSTYSFLASRLLREVARFGGDVSSLVPPPVAKRLAEKFPR